MVASVQWLISRFAITRHMTCVQNVRYTSERTEIGLPSRLERSDKITLVISSTDLTLRSMNPFDCQSATAECSSNVPRETRRFAISLNTSTIAAS